MFLGSISVQFLQIHIFHSLAFQRRLKNQIHCCCFLTPLYISSESLLFCRMLMLRGYWFRWCQSCRWSTHRCSSDISMLLSRLTDTCYDRRVLYVVNERNTLFFMFWLANYFSSVNAGIQSLFFIMFGSRCVKERLETSLSLKRDSWLVDESFSTSYVINGFLVGSWIS